MLTNLAPKKTSDLLNRIEKLTCETYTKINLFVQERGNVARRFRVYSEYMRNRARH